MAVIFSNGALEGIKSATSIFTGGAPAFTQRAVVNSLIYQSAQASTYAKISTSQPEVRSAISLISRSLAQINLKVYRRKSDSDREYLHNHPVMRVLRRPAPGITRFRLMAGLVEDYCTFGEAFLLKVRGEGRLQIVPISPLSLQVFGNLVPSGYRVTMPDGRQVDVPSSDAVYFRSSNPLSPLRGLSPLEAVRSLLAAEAEAIKARATFYANGARVSGLLSLPPDQEWSVEQQKQFLAHFNERLSGRDNTGKTGLLPPGVSYEAMDAASAESSQYVQSRELSRKETASCLGVSLSVLDGTANAEQLSLFYRETLAPLLGMIQDELELSLLSEFGDDESIYIEANIEEKMRGSMESQLNGLRIAVGQPYMSQNEARSRLNLPKDPNNASNELARPLYMAQGSPMTGEPDGGRRPENLPGTDRNA